MRQPVETAWFVKYAEGLRGGRVLGSDVLDMVRDLLAAGEKPSVSYVVAYAGEWGDVVQQVEVAIINAQVAKKVIDEVIDSTYDPATVAAKRLATAMRSVVASASDHDLEDEWLAWEILDPDQLLEGMRRAHQALYGEPEPDVSAAEALDRRIRSVS